MEMRAYCGIDCEKCPAYVAFMTDDDLLREKTAGEWSKMFNADIKAENVNCSGCKSTSDVLFSHCDECEIRACGNEKNVRNCGQCNDYACKKLSDLLQYLPKEKEYLDEVNQIFKSFKFSV